MTILDVNEEAPQFEDESYSVTIAENNPINITLVTVSASDSDYMENGTVSYSLSNDTYFRLGPVYVLLVVYLLFLFPKASMPMATL